MTTELQQTGSPEELNQIISTWRSNGEVISFVPTMGNLHEGHLTLVREAVSQSDRCVLSIFVNPMQFAPGDDYERYPRTLEADIERLSGLGVDLLFIPQAELIYPGGQAVHTRVEVPGLSDILCGEFRPGHFVGVATVVCKLFNLVQPDIALFGKKDYQQLMVIRRMVTDLAMPVDIIGVPTIREADGLAKSSRNQYLSAAQRRQAAMLYQGLNNVKAAVLSGAEDYESLTARETTTLNQAGFEVEYLSIRRAQDLEQAELADDHLVILVAARLGQARLIDNLEFNRSDGR